LKLHHLGYGCKNIDHAIDYLKLSGYSISDIGEVLVENFSNTLSCLVTFSTGEKIELIAGQEIFTPPDKELYLYFACYETDNINSTYSLYKNQGAIEIIPPTPSKIFQHQLIAILDYRSSKLKLIEARYQATNEARTNTSQNELLPASYNQQWFWFINSISSTSWYYNMPVALKVTGYFNILAFKEAVSTIIKRHDSLRTVFRNKAGTICRLILNDYELPFSIINSNNLSENELNAQVAHEAKNNFLLDGDDLLFKIKVIHLNEKNNFLYPTDIKMRNLNRRMSESYQ
jgi:hypothetical protein